MSNSKWMLSVKHSLEAARLIVDTLSNNKEWSRKHESLYHRLAHELMMRHKYEK